MSQRRFIYLFSKSSIDHGTLPRVELESGGREGGDAALSLLLLDHAAHVGQELLRVVNDAVLDRPADAADALDPARLVIQAEGPRAVQHLQILDGVLLHDHQICQEPRPHDAELDGFTTGLKESFGAVQGGAFTLQHVIFADYYGRESLGAVRSAVWPVQSAANATGPLVAALAYDATGGYRLVFSLFVLANVLSALCIFLAKPPAGAKQRELGVS